MAEFPTYEEMAKNVAEKALDDFLYNGKTIREWMQIITSEDCISKEDAKEAIRRKFKDLPIRCEINEVLNSLPSVQPKPKTGHWIEIAQYSDGKHKIECSECGSHIFDRGHANSFNVKNKYKYCPNCGAKMEE